MYPLQHSGHALHHVLHHVLQRVLHRVLGQAPALGQAAARQAVLHQAAPAPVPAPPRWARDAWHQSLRLPMPSSLGVGAARLGLCVVATLFSVVFLPLALVCSRLLFCALSLSPACALAGLLNCNRTCSFSLPRSGAMAVFLATLSPRNSVSRFLTVGADDEVCVAVCCLAATPASCADSPPASAHACTLSCAHEITSARSQNQFLHYRLLTLCPGAY